MKLEWEQIDNYHQRAPIFGGWLVKTYEDVSHLGLGYATTIGWDWRISMCFVPDPNHEWGKE